MNEISSITNEIDKPELKVSVTNRGHTLDRDDVASFDFNEINEDKSTNKSLSSSNDDDEDYDDTKYDTKTFLDRMLDESSRKPTMGSNPRNESQADLNNELTTSGTDGRSSARSSILTDADNSNVDSRMSSATREIKEINESAANLIMDDGAIDNLLEGECSRSRSTSTIKQEKNEFANDHQHQNVVLDEIETKSDRNKEFANEESVRYINKSLSCTLL